MFDLVFVGQVPLSDWMSGSKAGRIKVSLNKDDDADEERELSRKQSTVSSLPTFKRNQSSISLPVRKISGNLAQTKNMVRRSSSNNMAPPLSRKSSSIGLAIAEENRSSDSDPNVSRNRRENYATRRRSVAVPVDGISLLPSQCRDITVKGESLVILQHDGVMKIYSTVGMRTIPGVQSDSVMSCSDSHVIWANPRGVNVSINPYKIEVPSGLTGIVVTKVAAGHGYSLCCSNEGKLYSWGKGDRGCLGHGDTLPREDPTLITCLPFTKVVSISAGYSHSAIAASDGDVYVFGSGSHGQLGTGTTTDQHFPISLDIEETALTVECGGDEEHPFTLVLTLDGVVMSCGDNNEGKLGLGNKKGCKTLTYINKASFNNERVITISAGIDHCLAVTKSGLVYSWGLLSVRDQFGATRTRAEYTPKNLGQDGVSKAISKAFAGCKFSVLCSTSSTTDKK